MEPSRITSETDEPQTAAEATIEELSRNFELTDQKVYSGVVVSVTDALGEMPSPLRAQAIIVSLDLFAQMFKTGVRYEVIDGLPADARVIAMRYDPFRRLVGIAIESQEFAPVLAHEPLEEKVVRFQSIERRNE